MPKAISSESKLLHSSKLPQHTLPVMSFSTASERTLEPYFSALILMFRKQTSLP